MNIGIVVPYFTPYVRGNEYGLAQNLTRLGHNITIITSTARAPREKAITNNAHQDYKAEFDLRYLPVIIDIGDNPIVTGVKDHIKEQDIVMLQEDYPLICHKAYSAARKYDIPVILSSERTYFPENIAKRYALKLQDMISNRKLWSADALTAHCTAAKEFIIKELGVKKEITVIHVGVDTDIFRPEQSGRKYLTKGDFKLLTVARLHKYKGLEYLIKAMQTIKEKIPEVHLYIRGKGQEERNLKNLIDKLQINNIVSFLNNPISNYEGMHKLYAECDVYVQPSIVEPYGIAVVEAMACGKPVIGTDIGGMRDTVLDGETGFLVKPGNSAELAKRIMLLKDDGLRREEGTRARIMAEKEFDWKYIASRYQELIDGIIRS